MTKPLPYIAIEGVGKTKEEVLDSLIAIEPLLVMMGWDLGIDEGYNNTMIYTHNTVNLIGINLFSDGSYFYVNHKSHAPLRFKSTEINKLIKYMIDNKFIK